MKLERRSQIAELVRPACVGRGLPNEEFLADFVAEALLTWNAAGQPYEDIADILNKILKV